MCTVPTMTPQKNPLPSPLTTDYMHQILKRNCSIIHLMPCLRSSYHPASLAIFILIISQFFASSPVLIASPSVSPGPALSRRESFISRMKVLLLFDCARKVMTAAYHLPRMLLIFSCSARSSQCHYPYPYPPPPDPHPPLKQNSSQSFILGLKKIQSQQKQQWKTVENNPSKISR